MSNVILDTLKSVMAGSAPAKRIDPKVAALRGAIASESVRAGVVNECGADFLSELQGDVDRVTAIYHAVNLEHTEVAALARYEEQQKRAADRARAGEPADREDTWSKDDFIEEEATIMESKSDAARAISKERILPGMVKVSDAYAKHLGVLIGSIERQDAALYSQFGLPYEPSALVLALRESIDFARASVDAGKEILATVAK